MFTFVSFTLALALDPSAVEKQVKWALRAALRNVHRKCLLASADGAEVRNVPIEARQPQEAFHKARRLT